MLNGGVVVAPCREILTKNTKSKASELYAIRPPSIVFENRYSFALFILPYPAAAAVLMDHLNKQNLKQVDTTCSQNNVTRKKHYHVNHEKYSHAKNVLSGRNGFVIKMLQEKNHHNTAS